MKVELLLKDPVFQLNILLWMAKEQPPDHFRVRPLFHQLRFSIEYIEQPFFFPDELIGAVEASGIEISTKPEPELMLSRSEDNKCLYFEAKAGSFGPEIAPIGGKLWGTCWRQGRRSAADAPLTTCLLCYVLPGRRTWPDGGLPCRPFHGVVRQGPQTGAILSPRAVRRRFSTRLCVGPGVLRPCWQHRAT